MRLLDRYLLRELLTPLLFCLAGFFLLWLAFSLVSELDNLREQHLHASDIAEYYLVKAPEFLTVVLPVALLLALLHTLTTHARFNEITAMRAAGVSLWRLALPYFAVGLAGSIALFLINELWVPDSAELAEQIRTSRLNSKKNPADKFIERNLNFRNERDGRDWHADVYDRRSGEMTNPHVTRRMSDGSLRQLFAERGVRTNGVWTFFNARELRYPANTNLPPVPILQTNVLRMPEFTETAHQIKTEIKMSGRLKLSEGRNPDVPLNEILDYLNFHPRPAKELRFLLLTKMHARLATPWVCLVIVLIALPFGAATGRRNVFVGVASSVFIAFAYFAIQQFSMAMGVGAYIPPWLAAWLPNFIFGGAGAWLTIRAR